MLRAPRSHGFPRMRGDEPYAIRFNEIIGEFSPHARG